MKKLDQQNVKEIAERMYGLKAAEDLLKQKRGLALGFEQPLPDVIGFKQHDSECASDSIQELLLFADGIREYTQPIMYGLTKEQVETRTSLTLTYEEWHPLQEYFYYVQRRFQAHYDVLNYMRVNGVDAQKYYDEHDEVCLLNPLFKQKEAASIEFGVLALKHYKGEARYKGAGLSFRGVEKIVDGMLTSMGVPYKRVASVDKAAVGMVVFCKNFNIDAAGKENESSLGHVVSFMKAQGQWLYYDNNMGFLPLAEEVVDALAADCLRIVIYRRVYFVKTDAHGAWSSAFDGKKWSKELLKELYKKGKPVQGIYFYKGDPKTCVSIVSATAGATAAAKICGPVVSDLKEPVKALAEFRSCIYANIESNSKIFENMYHYIYDNIDLIKTIPDELASAEKGMKTVVLRPACSPMTHYWCSKINMALKGIATDSMQWYKLPKLARVAHQRERARTPAEFVKRRGEEMGTPRTPRLTPCLPGQVRNAKTRRCKDRPVKEVKVDSKGVPIKRSRKAKSEGKERASPCPKGEIRDKKTGQCVPKDDPCPPGQVRDKETKLCRDRLLQPCPEGQVRDAKTKKCRDAIGYKF